jgi:type I restriction enzyme S subunit
MNGPAFPDGWSKSKLGDCCQVVSGGTPRRERLDFWNGQIPWATPKDISSLTSPEFYDPPERISMAGLHNSSATLLPKGSILFSSRAPIGLVAIAGRDMATNQGFKSLIPGPNLDSRFLYWTMKRLSPRIADLGRGATFKEVSKAIIADVEIQFPNDLNEQRRIALILDKSDGLRRKSDQLLASTDDFLRSTFLERFGSPLTNEKGLQVACIRDLAEVVTGNTPPRKDAGNYGPGIEWIKSDNLNSAFHIPTKAEETLSSKGRMIGRIAPAGSTLVTCIAGSPNSIGNAAITDREVSFNQQINAAIPRPNVDPHFLYCQFLVGKPLIQAASTNSMKGMVSKGKFQEIEFLSPPFSEQRQFGELFRKTMLLIQQLRSWLLDSVALAGILEQSAFRGELGDSDAT